MDYNDEYGTSNQNMDYADEYAAPKQGMDYADDYGTSGSNMNYDYNDGYGAPSSGDFSSDEFNDFVENMAYFSKGLNVPIVRYLAEHVKEYFGNKALVSLLAEYKKRREAEVQELASNFVCAAKGENADVMWGNYNMTHASSYAQVIADMTYNDWWQQHGKEF